jgi:hypothetical protein
MTIGTGNASSIRYRVKINNCNEMKYILLSSMIILAMVGCKSQQQNNDRSRADKPHEKTQFMAVLPHVLIYKTKKDYSHNVPVLLSDDKMQIISYPHPTDLLIGENLALPAPLHNGYLLDNRGINNRVAFLKYTYEEYSTLKDVPTLQELQRSILDKDPLTELWDCGKKANFTDLQKQLNEWIDKDLLPEKFKRIK